MMPSLRKCSCGKDIPIRNNTTIQAKKCPSCTYHELYSRKTAKKATISSPEGEYEIISTKTSKSSVKNNALKTVLNAKKESAKYMRLADTWFSRLVRLTFCCVSEEGEAYCLDIVTGKLYQAKNIDCGHFISRANMSTRYNLDNCRPQNRSSNRYRGEADKPMFERNLISEIGNERMQALKDKINSSGKFGQLELKELADTFRAQVNQIAKEKKIKKWW